MMISGNWIIGRDVGFMPKVSFVIGATASGKTYYINQNYADILFGEVSL